MSRKKTKFLAAGDTTFYQFDELLGFWGIPNLSHEIAYDGDPDNPVTATHNSEGNRDLEVKLDKSKKTIVCLGGSHSWGLAVEQDSRYSDLLRQSTGCNVLNLAHPSLGLDQICLALLNKTGRYKPDIVIVEQYPWAIHRILSTYVNGFVKPNFSLDPDGNLKLNKVPKLAKYNVFRKLLGSFYDYRKEFLEYRSGIDISSNYDPKTDPIFLHWKTTHYDYMYRLVEQILKVMRDYCRQNQIKLVFALGVVNQQFGESAPSALVDYDLPRKRFVKQLEKNNINYIDMLEPMLKDHSPESSVAFYDGHINTRGHALFADVIESYLDANDWLKK